MKQNKNSHSIYLVKSVQIVIIKLNYGSRSLLEFVYRGLMQLGEDYWLQNKLCHFSSRMLRAIGLLIKIASFCLLAQFNNKTSFRRSPSVGKIISLLSSSELMECFCKISDPARLLGQSLKFDVWKQRMKDFIWKHSYTVESHYHILINCIFKMRRLLCVLWDVCSDVRRGRANMQSTKPAFYIASCTQQFWFG